MVWWYMQKHTCQCFRRVHIYSIEKSKSTIMIRRRISGHRRNRCCVTLWYIDNYKSEKICTMKDMRVAERCPRPLANSQWSTSRLEGAVSREKRAWKGEEQKCSRVSRAVVEATAFKALHRPAVGQRTRERFVKIIDHGEWFTNY